MATTVNATLKHKRGTEASMPTLKDGQIYLCSDTHKMYKGTSTGENILISDIASLNQTVKKTDIVNNALANIEGKVLDATVGKFLNDKIDKIKFASLLITANEFTEGTGTDTLTFVISGSETNLFSTKPVYVNAVAESFNGYLERYNFDESTDGVIKLSLKNTKGNFESGLSYRYGILIVS